MLLSYLISLELLFRVLIQRNSVRGEMAWCRARVSSTSRCSWRGNVSEPMPLFSSWDPPPSCSFGCEFFLIKIGKRTKGCFSSQVLIDSSNTSHCCQIHPACHPRSFRQALRYIAWDSGSSWLAFQQDREQVKKVLKTIFFRQLRVESSGLDDRASWFQRS